MEKNDVLLNDLFNWKKQNLNKKTMVDNFCFNPENTIKLTKEEIAEIFNDNINPEKYY